MKEALCKTYGLTGLRYDEKPERVGLWLPSNKKIGFIGIQAQKWIVSHGFSINLTKESLKGFKEIDPCGLLNQNINVTCVENETDIMNMNHNTDTDLTDSIVESFLKIFELNKIE